MAKPSSAEKWNRRFAKTNTASAPARVLTDHLHLLPIEGAALDLACGMGSNALVLAAHGLNTSAWDVSDVGLDQLSQNANKVDLVINTRLIDLEQDPFPTQTFDVITVCHYLHRPLFNHIISALNSGGMVFYQTFLSGNSKGPSNPSFCLRQGELRDVFSPLNTLYYCEDKQINDSAKLAYYIGQKPTS